jgi:hypothetical protein
MGGEPQPAMTVEVAFEERYWYPEDGGEVWLAGYQVVDPESGRFLPRDAPQLARAPAVRLTPRAGSR